MKVNLTYRFSLEFSQRVRGHSFALKITPRQTPFYKIEDFYTSLKLANTTDGFGNIISFGIINESHYSFEVETSAKIDFYHEYFDLQHGILPDLYSVQTQITTSSINSKQEFLDFINELKIINYNNKKNIDLIVSTANDFIFKNFIYQSGITTAYSSIDMILNSKRGVCQDFAHLLISYLRHLNIPARYVSGFVTGEGESHAWVEYFDGQIWRGADPTHNLIIKNEPYIKLAHGRDSSDTAMNKGSFIGHSKQNLKVFTHMEVSI